MERKWTLEVHVWNQYILERMDSVNGEISMNRNDQYRSKLIWRERLTVLVMAQTTRVLL